MSDSRSAFHAANVAPAGGAALSTTSPQSQSSLRPSILAPPVCRMYGGLLRLRHETASKNQYRLSVVAAYCESRQWLADKRYGRYDVCESLISVPVHQSVSPLSWVNMMRATLFAASATSGACGITHATSISQLPAP